MYTSYRVDKYKYIVYIVFRDILYRFQTQEDGGEVVRLDYVKIYCLMADKNLNQKELAKSAGFSREATGKAIKGQVNCSPGLAGAIARALNVETRDILQLEK